MPSFVDFLRSRENFPELCVPYYQRWADMYQRHIAQKPAASSDQDRLTSFLNYLSKRYPEGRVKQARHAVQMWIYFSRTHSRVQRPSPTNASFQPARTAMSPTNDPVCSARPPEGGKLTELPAEALSEDLAQEASRLMRLKHLSYRTEKSLVAQATLWKPCSPCCSPTASVPSPTKHKANVRTRPSN